MSKLEHSWTVKLICCGRDDGEQYVRTWAEADAMRETYCSGVGVRTKDNPSGHERSAIVIQAGIWAMDPLPPHQPSAAGRVNDNNEGESIMNQKPSIGRIVHYVTYDAPGRRATVRCRAAIISEVEDDQTVGLVVLNPQGMFFNQHLKYDAGAETPGDPNYEGEHMHDTHRFCPCGWMEASLKGGTWHWPEHV